MQGPGIHMACTLPQCRGDTMRPRLSPVCKKWKFVIGLMLPDDLLSVCGWGASKTVRFASNHSAAMHER